MSTLITTVWLHLECVQLMINLLLSLTYNSIQAVNQEQIKQYQLNNIVEHNSRTQYKHVNNTSIVLSFCFG